VAIRITVCIQGLFSGFVTSGRYGKWLTRINLLLHPVIHSYWFARWLEWRDWYPTLVRRAVAEVGLCIVLVLLVIIVVITINSCTTYNIKSIWLYYLHCMLMIYVCAFYFFVSSFLNVITNKHMICLSFSLCLFLCWFVCLCVKLESSQRAHTSAERFIVGQISSIDWSIFETRCTVYRCIDVIRSVEIRRVCRWTV